MVDHVEKVVEGRKDDFRAGTSDEQLGENVLQALAEEPERGYERFSDWKLRNDIKLPVAVPESTSEDTVKEGAGAENGAEIPKVTEADWDTWARLHHRHDDFVMVGDRLVRRPDANAGRRRGSHQGLERDKRGGIAMDENGNPIAGKKSGIENNSRHDNKLAGQRELVKAQEKDERRGRETGWRDLLDAAGERYESDLPQRTLNEEEDEAYKLLFDVREIESQVEAERIAKETDETWHENDLEKAKLPSRQLSVEENAGFRETFRDGWDTDERLSEDDRRRIRRTEQFVTRNVSERRQVERAMQGLDRLPTSVPRQHDHNGTRRGSHQGEGGVGPEPGDAKQMHIGSMSRFERRHPDRSPGDLLYMERRADGWDPVRRMEEAVDELRRAAAEIKSKIVENQRVMEGGQNDENQYEISGENEQQTVEPNTEDRYQEYMTQEQRDNNWMESEFIHDLAMERIADGFPNPDLLSREEKMEIKEFPEYRRKTWVEIQDIIKKEEKRRGATRWNRIEAANPGKSMEWLRRRFKADRRNDSMILAEMAVEQEPSRLVEARAKVIKEFGFEEPRGLTEKMEFDMKEEIKSLRQKQAKEWERSGVNPSDIDADVRAMEEREIIDTVADLLRQKYAYLGWDEARMKAAQMVAYEREGEVLAKRGTPRRDSDPRDMEEDWRKRSLDQQGGPKRSPSGAGWSHR